MKYLFFAVFVLLFVNNTQNISNQNDTSTWSNSNLKNKIIGKKMKMKIGTKTFTVNLYNNETTEAFKTMLPLTLTMSELNSNEKYAQLSTNLPTSTAEIGTIHEGDLMLWGGKHFGSFL